MMNVFSETFNTLPLSERSHEPPILEMCPALVGKVEDIGWRESGLEQGTTHAMMYIEKFVDAHVNMVQSITTCLLRHFFPKSIPSGPDVLFFIRIDGICLVPVFVQVCYQMMQPLDSSATIHYTLFVAIWLSFFC
jgi:hypothetical protein